MKKQDDLNTDQQELVQAWNRILPAILNGSDKAVVKADEADRKALRIAVQTEGRSNYSFDFKCMYVDSREVKVDLVDVEADGKHVDEHTEIIQNLIEDYVRHIHECAQSLQRVTHA